LFKKCFLDRATLDATRRSNDIAAAENLKSVRGAIARVLSSARIAVLVTKLVNIFSFSFLTADRRQVQEVTRIEKVVSAGW